MKSLFEKEALDEIVKRINTLSPSSQRQWGKMNVDQMLAHCSVGIKSATGEKVLKSGLLLRLIGSMLKSQTTNDTPISKSTPTHKEFIISITEGFEKEKQSLISLITNFQQSGEKICTTNPHVFFGKLNPKQWGSLMYKHIDHHLKQFGV